MPDNYNKKPRTKSINPMQDDFSSMKTGAAGPIKSAFKYVEKAADQFAMREIAKMNSKKIGDHISAWSKIGVPAATYEIYKANKKKD
jgi:hypothetical protein